MRTLREAAERHVVDVGGEERVEVHRRTDSTAIRVIGRVDAVEIRFEALVRVSGLHAGRRAKDVGYLVGVNAIPSEVVRHHLRLRREQYRRGAGSEYGLLRAVK